MSLQNRSAIVHFHAVKCINLAGKYTVRKSPFNGFGSLNILKNTFHFFHFFVNRHYCTNSTGDCLLKMQIHA